jgi:hypothetical protein
MTWNPTPAQIEQLPRLATLAAKFRAAGFTDSVRPLLGAIGGPGWIDNARLTLASGGVLPQQRTLIELLLLGEFVPAEQVHALLGTDGAEAMLATGLLATDGFALRGTAMITPFADRYIVSDRSPDRDLASLPSDYVLPVNASTQLLTDLTVRRPGAIAADIGSGQGLHALLAAGHMGRVIATDVNPRALAMTRATAALNGVTSIEVRSGSMLEPLADLRGKLDLLVCNPPFVLGDASAPVAVSAQTAPGEGTIAQLVTNLPGMLREGGWATVLSAWTITDPKDWSARPRGWLDSPNRGGNAFIFRFEQLSPDAYYTQWLAGGPGDPGADAWKQTVAKLGIAAVAFGAIVFNKRAGENWIRTQLANIRGRFGSASDQLASLFDVLARLAAMPDQSKALDWKLRFVADRRVVIPDAGAQGVPQLIHTRGLALPVPLDPRAEASLARFDGTRPARVVLDELAAQGLTSGNASSPAAVQSILSLVLMGYLVPVDAPKV